MDDVPAAAPTALECGRAFRAPRGAAVTVTAKFPSVVSVADRAFSGTVEIASDSEVVRAVVSRSADVFLVRDGRIATVPLAQDSVGVRLELVPGTVREMPAQGMLSPCDPEGPAEGSLPPGTYELYARVVLNNDDGSTLETIGGPWPLEVR